MGRGRTPDKQCPSCPDVFWTQVGLDEHLRIGQHNTNAVTIRRIPGSTARPAPVKKPQPAPAPVKKAEPELSPTRLAASQAQGYRLAARNNARRFRCDECGHESTPAGVGVHQKFSGHTGRTELELEKAA